MEIKAELKYAIFDTSMGWVGILGSERGLLGTTLPQSSSQEILKLLGDKVNQATFDLGSFEDLVRRFRAYFEGHKATFPDGLDLFGATPFHRKVWEVTRLIPFGETRSYAWVAEQVGKPKAARAVGQALARNHWPIIVPCHRVLTSNGKLGGFGGGVGMKRYLLNLEAMASIQ